MGPWVEHVFAGGAWSHCVQPWASQPSCPDLWPTRSGSAVPPDGESPRTYVVRSGDTLWSIAARFAPASDPRVVVDTIASANGVDPGALVPGQRLSIPSVG